MIGVRDGLAQAMADAMGWDWQTEPGVPSPAEAMYDAADAALAYLATQRPTVEQVAEALEGHQRQSGFGAYCQCGATARYLPHMTEQIAALWGAS